MKRNKKKLVATERVRKVKSNQHNKSEREKEGKE